ncbi:hypothetical protein RM844_20465 [Streptomyces sp. DSM 44915]|uniref:Antibiotic biosynthesis monooxygenase n=1 Tax=Streptomyces chisholmiae TaxID=3075540 RepID=A0ABU2JV88_9ACTN|nr:hypothetical protein [Streptomyces sp. DSM 44915]MDT0268663.1 hypothetical protein [Streptomyces sp. DSM 44915]
MSVHTVRFRTTPERVTTVAERIAAVCAAVRAEAPAGVRYTAFQDADEPVFTLVLELADGVANPLPSIPAAADFRRWLPGQTDDDLTPKASTVVGGYPA